MTQRFVDTYLGYLLGQANHALFKDFEAQVQAAGLTSIEWRVLATLHDSDAMAVTQLAQEVLSKQPTVTKLVQRMAAQGWVSLWGDAQDQRRTLVAIEKAGLRLVKPLIEAAKQQEAQVMKGLDATEIEAIKELLLKLTRLD